MATLTLRPNGAGNQQGWNAEGGDYTRVDESSSDGDTTRLYSPTDNAVATFAMEDHTTQEGVINSVTVYIYTRGLDPISNTVQLAVRTGGTDYFSSTQTYNNTSYHNESNAWSTNPGTSAAWTWSEIDALEAGMKRIGGGGQAVTQVWMEVDYTPATIEQEGFRFRNDDGVEGNASIALDGSVISTDSADTQSMTVGNNPNRLLIVAFGTHQGSGPSGVTYGGVSMTKIKEQVGSFGEQVSLWGLLAPTVGTANVVVSGVSSYRAMSIYSLYNVDQSSLPSVTQGASGNSSGASLSITPSVDNCWIIDVCTAEDDLTMTTASGVNDATQIGASYENVSASHFIQTTAGAKTMSYTVGSGQRWNIAAIAIKPAIGATWLASQDTNITRAKSTNTRLRLLLNATGNPDTRKYYLYYKLSTDGTYIPVPTSGSGPITLSPSSNITASGEATTALLTAPAGKSTSDFVAGRMQDDENPADTIDITTDDYTELEWSLIANAAATNGDIYQFRAYKYLETFATELTTGGTASALGENAPNETAAKAFDDDSATKWLHFTGSATWLKYDFGSGVAWLVTKYVLTSANDDDTRDPKDFKLQGSNDDSSWTDVDTVTGETFASRGLRKEFTCDTPGTTAYRYYRFYINANNGNGSITQLAEIQLYRLADPVAVDTYTVTPEWTIGTAGGPIKAVNGLAIASVKTVNGLAIASVKTINGLTNV